LHLVLQRRLDEGAIENDLQSMGVTNKVCLVQRMLLLRLLKVAVRACATHLIWRLDVEMDAVPIHGLAILFRALVFHGAASCARLNRRLKHN